MRWNERCDRDRADIPSGIQAWVRDGGGRENAPHARHRAPKRSFGAPAHLPHPLICHSRSFRAPALLAQGPSFEMLAERCFERSLGILVGDDRTAEPLEQNEA